jgi:hypothetical protein
MPNLQRPLWYGLLKLRLKMPRPLKVYKSETCGKTTPWLGVSLNISLAAYQPHCFFHQF